MKISNKASVKFQSMSIVKIQFEVISDIDNNWTIIRMILKINDVEYKIEMANMYFLILILGNINVKCKNATAPRKYDETCEALTI